jgi:predicted small metal-binding protein
MKNACYEIRISVLALTLFVIDASIPKNYHPAHQGLTSAIRGGKVKTLRCRDVGVDCDFVAEGETEQEVMAKAAEHARKHHGLKISPRN